MKRGSHTGVAAVDRALKILNAFSEQDSALTLAELASRTGLYKSTILRLAGSLERGGMLRRLQDGRSRLGPALLKLGNTYRKSFRIDEYAQPILEALADKTGESASLYVRDGDKRICLVRVNSRQHRVLHYVTPATALPLETGAAGQVIMRHTQRMASTTPDGGALVVSASNRKSDTAAIACPVFGAQGFVGALSLAGPRTRFTEESVRVMSADVLDAAARLSEALSAVAAELRRQAGHGTST